MSLQVSTHTHIHKHVSKGVLSDRDGEKVNGTVEKHMRKRREENGVKDRCSVGYCQDLTVISYNKIL